MAKIHFLDVGCSDTTIIQNQSETIMVDCKGIENYSHLLPLNKRIKALFITHQHYDHFLGMKFLKDKFFSIEYLVYSPYQRRFDDNSVDREEWDEFNRLVQHFKNNGSKVHLPYRQESFNSPWATFAEFQVWMIGPVRHIATKTTRELHDASLVFLLKNTNSLRRCCFTGDASDESLNWIAKNTTNYCEDILHASHHGSINGADLDFIKNANPLETIISTKSGVYDNIPHPTAIDRYKSNTKGQTLRTDLTGTISMSF